MSYVAYKGRSCILLKPHGELTQYNWLAFASNYIKLFLSEIDNQNIATCNLVGIQQYGFVINK